MTYSIFHSTRALQLFLELLAAIAILLAWRFPHRWARGYRALERSLKQFSGNRLRAVLAAGLFPMLIRLLLLPVFPIPVPRVHDEFSYLLLGDTLAHHRVANPTPPYWQHFETEYELMKPSYASQYEPAQGVALAAGEIITGNPWWGVWLSVGLMCAALCWGLSFAIPVQWALFGSLIAALQFGVFGFWMNSYFGGAVPAIGGALIFGALASRGEKTALKVGAAGLVIVLASRPIEGMIWLGASLIVLLWRRIPLRAAAIPCLIVIVGGLGLAEYNRAVTGNAFQCPYSSYRQDYGTPQSYWWQPRTVVASFNNPELAANYEDQLRYWERRYSARALWDSTWHRLRDFWRFFIGPFLAPAALFGLFAARRKRLRLWVWISIPFILDHATYHAWYPQQSASETILIVLFIVEGWRALRAWRRRTGVGLAISRNLAGGLAVASALLCIGLASMPVIPERWHGLRQVWDTMTVPPDARTLAISRLNRIPGKHLVFVQYGASHPWYDEWVFNGADLSGSRIVFARICTPDSDRALAKKMSDRDVWVVTPDSGAYLTRVTPAQLLLASASR